MYKISLFLLGLFISIQALAQIDSNILHDSLAQKLPFNISEEKRLPAEDLENKKEGFFVTGLPQFEYDPIRGIGVGGTMFLLQNGTKEDPFFEYTPYRYRISTEFKVFQNGRASGAVNLDVPYLFNTRWRLRLDAKYWEDPNAQYFGIGSHTLRPLRFRDNITGLDRTFSNMNNYLDNLALAREQDGNFITDFHYNQFFQREQLYNFLFERVFYEGKLRLMFGYEMLFTKISDYTGMEAEDAFLPDGTRVKAINDTTLIFKESTRPGGSWDRFNLSGLSNDDWAFTSMLAFALIYDTRDLEPDPSKGVFLQYSHEYSAPFLGSHFDFNKFMVQGQYFNTFARWRNNKSRLTLAAMGSIGYVWGRNVNFLEMFDLSSQAEAGGILVLGGPRSLRGYREVRFLAPVVGLVNLELRSRLYDFNLAKQHFGIGLTPFLDMGSVWDTFGEMDLKNIRATPGIGGRLAWNQSTILRLDFASSSEGNQFFLGFGHIF